MLLQDPGEAAVLRAIGEHRPSLMSVVNAAEVVGRLARRGLAAGEAWADLLTLGMEVVAFDGAMSVAAGALKPRLRGSGISLAARACQVLGHLRGAPILTGDRAWAALDLGVEVRLIR